MAVSRARPSGPHHPSCDHCSPYLLTIGPIRPVTDPVKQFDRYLRKT